MMARQSNETRALQRTSDFLIKLREAEMVPWSRHKDIFSQWDLNRASYLARLFDGWWSPRSIDDGWWSLLRPIEPQHWNEFGFGRRQPIGFFRLPRRVGLEIQVHRTVRV